MNFTKKSYEAFDLFIFTLIATCVEGLNVFVFNTMTIKVGDYSFNQLYTLSFACLLGMIAIYRWNLPGIVVAPIAGLGSLLVRLSLRQEVTINLWLSYTVGYLGLMSCLLFFRKRDKGEMRKETGFMFLYYFSGYLSVEVVRSLCQIGQANYGFLLLNYLSFDLLNILVSAIVFFIALKQNSLIVDMNTYLKELNELKTKIGGEEIVSKNINISVEELAEADEINEAAILDGGTLSSDDLKKMEENRRKFENVTTKYDAENQELENYRKNKEAKHGGR